MSEPAWYVLTVRAGMERAAVAAVQRVGAEVFLPAEQRWVRAHRRRRGARRKEARLYVSLPGYLFVHMPDWLAAGRGWDDILDLDLVHGVVMRHVCVDAVGPRRVWKREPFRLPPAWRLGGWLDGRVDLAALDAAVAPAEPVYDIATGDAVIVTHEAFDRYPGKVVGIETKDGQAIARVLMAFLGAEREIRVPADDLVRASDSKCSA